MIGDLWNKPVKAVNLGMEGFYKDLLSLGVETVNIDWKPAARGDKALLEALDLLEEREETEAANQVVLDRINAAQPVWVDVEKAGDAIPGMRPNMLLHAGPPITWERMSGPLRGAVIGAILFERMARTPEEAEKLAAGGEIVFSPCHEHGAVGPMAGVVSPSMPVFVIENKNGGNRSFSTMNEGLGKVLRFGAYGPDVLERLEWMKNVLAPGLKKAVRQAGGIDLKAITAQALHMGDETHNRNKAATSLLIRELISPLLAVELDREERIRIIEFLNANDHFFLNLSMAMAKAILDAADGVKGSTVVTAMTRNGTDFGIRVSGLPGRWFTGPAQEVKGLLFPGFSEADKNPDMGDSAITETVGLGGFSMAASPAIVQFVGGEPKDAIRFSEKMYQITVGESTAFSIPVLGFRGSPTGIDVCKVVRTDVLPQINTGIAHRDAGVGQVGAGLVCPPWDCFREALLALAAQYK